MTPTTSIPRVVLVTGASDKDGIGFATVARLAKCGHRVYATCQDPAKAKELRALASQIPFTVLPLDVTSQESIKCAVKVVREREGTLDVVVNNAGIAYYGPSETHTIKEAQKVMDVNYFGVLRMDQEVLPLMREKGGTIVNVGTISGVIPSKNLPVYAASQAALTSHSASLQEKVEKWGIRVVLIQPGPVVTGFAAKTPFGARFKDLSENPYADRIVKERAVWSGIMKDGQSPEEVAKVIQRVIESPEKRHWYQTSKAVEKAVGEHYKDITGNNRISLPRAKL